QSRRAARLRTRAAPAGRWSRRCAVAACSYPAPRFGFAQRPLELGALGLRGGEQVAHGERRRLVGGEEGGIERDVADAAAGDVEARELAVVEARGRRRRWHAPSPDR